MKIGIIGGTFNPIHVGHLVLSEYIRDELNLDKIIFIPTGRPPHKSDKNIAKSIHRWNMLELSIKDNPYFELCDIELNSVGISYTIDTVGELKKLHISDDLTMIIGADSLLSLENWKRGPDLIQKINFVVADRLIGKKQNVINEVKALNHKYGVNIRWVDSPIIEISSTDIRDRIKNNKSIKYLVKEDVNKYINDNNLYK